jgi:GGDEF domain-containing protein
MEDELLNRLGFDERLVKELARVRAESPGLALVVLDFDDFNDVNDQFGHSAGDQLLRWAVQAMAGVAVAPEDGLDADPLHQRADERLYEAKRQSPSSARRRTTNSLSSSSTASSIGGLS